MEIERNEGPSENSPSGNGQLGENWATRSISVRFHARMLHGDWRWKLPGGTSAWRTFGNPAGWGRCRVTEQFAITRRGVERRIESEAAEDAMDHVYVSLGNARQIVHYHLDPQSGRMIRKATLEVPGTPGAQVVSEDKQRLYVAIRSLKSVSKLRIDPTSGRLTLESTTPVAENPVYLALAPSGRHLLMSSYNGNLAAIYPTGRKGFADGDGDAGLGDGTESALHHARSLPAALVTSPTPGRTAFGSFTSTASAVS
jgi:hypothetical protein